MSSDPAGASSRAATVLVSPSAPPPAEGRDLADTLVASEEVAARASELLDTVAGNEQVQAPEDGPAPARIGRFTVLRRLGAGGMGVVYAAYDDELDRKVAIKLLHPSHHGGSVGSARVLREAQAMARLSHPNVVQVYELGRHEGRGFVTMEFIQGRTLGEWVGAGRAWPEILDMFIQAGRGLAAAHDAGLIHRDFKPANVLVGDDGRARVLDFGLARSRGGGEAAPTGELEEASRESLATTGRQALREQLTVAGSIMGTPEYMSPEQHRGATVDATSDQFSFCVALHEALYGQSPFTGDTLATRRASVTRGELRPPPRDARVPPWLRAAITRGLAPRPEDRWPSMAALLHALSRDPARARRRVLALAGAGALAVMGAGAVYLARSGEAACAGARAQLEGVWDDARRERLRQAIEGASLSYAAEVWRRVEPGLDARADAWVEMHTEACEAHRAGRQSAALLDARMECLERRRGELGALVEVLAEADARVVERGVQAVRELRGLHDCEDMTSLRARVEPPRDPAVAAEVARLREALARAKAFEQTGQYAPGEALAARLVAEADALEYPPLRAEARLRHGLLLDRVSRSEEAVATLAEAYWTAGAAADYDVAVEAGISAAFVSLAMLSRPSEGRLWRRNAVMLMARGGVRPELRVLERTVEATALDIEGDEARAEQVHQESVDMAARTLPPDHVYITGTMVNLGLLKIRRGAAAEGVALLRRAIELDERNLGPEHPELLPALLGLVDALVLAGELDDAAAAIARAESIATLRLGMDADMLGTIAMSRGEVAEARGQNAEALASYGEALAKLAEVPDSAELLEELRDRIARLRGQASPS